MNLTPMFVAALDFPTLPQQLANGLYFGAVYALIALGYTMVYGVLRLINFAHGEVYMLGAYTALFVSYSLGYSPGAATTPEGTWVNLALMLLASMTVCAVVGVLIERFAYRPMRKQPRIASLITAIGVSLLLQYAGALFLPNSPQPSISEKVNPFRGAVTFVIKPAPAELQNKVQELEPAYDQTKETFEDYLKTSGADRFNLPPEGIALRQAAQEMEKQYNGAKKDVDVATFDVTLQKGQIIILGLTLVLMSILTYLVMFTKMGRAMRAVALDFDSAALMGVNVNTVIVFTFIIGSSLAGAGAMMTATFLGTPLSTQYGVGPGVKAFVAAVLGGIGNIPGAVIGGLFLGLAENLVTWFGYSQYKEFVAFIILIAVLLFRPGGILGSNKVEKV